MKIDSSISLEMRMREMCAEVNLKFCFLFHAFGFNIDEEENETEE